MYYNEHSDFYVRVHSLYRSLCKSGVTEAALDYSVVKAEDADILDALVRFMYLGATDFTKKNVTSLATAADFIKHDELKRECENYLISNLSIQNLVACHQLSEKAHLPALSKECYQFRLKTFNQVVTTEWFLSLSIKELEDYLQDDELNVVSEDDVIEAILKWLQASTASEKGQEGYIEVLFPCIRLEFCAKSKLESLSEDPEVIDKLRLKILEYLYHGEAWRAEKKKIILMHVHPHCQPIDIRNNISKISSTTINVRDTKKNIYKISISTKSNISITSSFRNISNITCR